jgi:predicted HTH domain antitoxin
LTQDESLLLNQEERIAGCKTRESTEEIRKRSICVHRAEAMNN